MKRIVSALTVVSMLMSCCMLAAPNAKTTRPNILWITCEDMSPNLGCYGDAYADTPNLDKLARQSVRYTHAFATAPACSPSRSTLITGRYATSLNTQHLRSAFPIPAEFKAFPTYLRERGFFCSNNTKTDYNTANERQMIKAGWDECSGKAHWRNRQTNQPFFSVFNFTETHQSRTSMGSAAAMDKLFSEYLPTGKRHDPAKVSVPPFYPDTPLVRQTLARYYDCISVMDARVGMLLKQLQEDGLADETIVFFFSDHGMGMPRGKRTLYDSGMRVPLLIRFPEKFQHLAPAAAGQMENRLVSFVDFAPTVFSLLGLDIPKQMEGTPFLGKESGKPREVVFGARDRVDEAFDLARSARNARYLYIRNYMPHLPWNQPEGSSDRSDMRRQITRLAAEGKLNATQLTYAGTTRPIEELYDTESDPHQVRNLASSPNHQRILEQMRKQTKSWILQTRDIGFLPEEEVWTRLRNDTPFDMAQDADRYPLSRILESAELVGQRDVAAARKMLAAPDRGARYWAVIALRAAGEKGNSARDALKEALNDPAAAVRIEAAAALAHLGDVDAGLATLTKELRSSQRDVVLHAARSLQLLGEKARSALPAMKQALADCPQGEHRIYMDFVVTAAAHSLEQGDK